MNLISICSLFLKNLCHTDSVEEQQIDVKEREEMKIAQLEHYMTADENQGIVDLSLYI